MSTARAFIHRPFDGHIVMKPTGVLLAKLAGDVGFRNVGNYENVTYTIEKEEEEIWSPQAPERVKIGTIYNEVNINLAFGLQQLIPLMRSVVMQSDAGLVLDQAAVADKVVEIADLETGGIFPLGYRDVTKVAVAPAAGGGQPYVEGTHFQYDAPTGHLEIIEHPGKAEKASVKVTVSAAAVAGRKLWGVASKLDIRGSVMFRSTNKYGPRQLVEFWDVGLTGDGEVALGSNSSDQGTVSVMGKVYADATREAAFAYGRATDIPQG